MEITKTKPNVKDPEKHGLTTWLFVPGEFPGSHFLAPGQSVEIGTGLTIKVPSGFVLVPVNEPRYHLALLGADTEELTVSVTNVGDEVEEIKPGEYLASVFLLPSLDSPLKIQQHETGD